MKTLQTTRHEPLQIMPPGETKAVYRDRQGKLYATPLVALAVCRVWETVCDLTSGKVLHAKLNLRREVCGIEGFVEDGFLICETMINHVGYLRPGYSLEEYAIDSKQEEDSPA